jgi:hypothetical protein
MGTGIVLRGPIQTNRDRRMQLNCWRRKLDWDKFRALATSAKARPGRRHTTNVVFAIRIFQVISLAFNNPNHVALPAWP